MGLSLLIFRVHKRLNTNLFGVLGPLDPATSPSLAAVVGISLRLTISCLWRVSLLQQSSC